MRQLAAAFGLAMTLLANVAGPLIHVMVESGKLRGSLPACFVVIEYRRLSWTKLMFRPLPVSVLFQIWTSLTSLIFIPFLAFPTTMLSARSAFAEISTAMPWPSFARD